MEKKSEKNIEHIIYEEQMLEENLVKILVNIHLILILIGLIIEKAIEIYLKIRKALNGKKHEKTAIFIVLVNLSTDFEKRIIYKIIVLSYPWIFIRHHEFFLDYQKMTPRKLQIHCISRTIQCFCVCEKLIVMPLAYQGYILQKKRVR